MKESDIMYLTIEDKQELVDLIGKAADTMERLNTALNIQQKAIANLNVRMLELEQVCKNTTKRD